MVVPGPYLDITAISDGTTLLPVNHVKECLGLIMVDKHIDLYEIKASLRRSENPSSGV